MTSKHLIVTGKYSLHRTKLQESVNGNVAETCQTVPETRRITCVSVTGFVTFSRVSVAAYTTEPDHFYVNITETWSCMFPPRFRLRILAISSCASLNWTLVGTSTHLRENEVISSLISIFKNAWKFENKPKSMPASEKAIWVKVV